MKPLLPLLFFLLFSHHVSQSQERASLSLSAKPLETIKTSNDGNVWNLSDTETVANSNARYLMYGDTLISETIDGNRRWYSVKSNNVYLIREESLRHACVPASPIQTRVFGNSEVPDETEYVTTGHDRHTSALRREGIYSSFPPVLVSDETRNISSISYDNNGFPYSVMVDHGDRKTQMIMVRDYSGNLLARHTNEIKTGVRRLESIGYSGDGQIVRNDTLVMSRFEGGYFDYDGKPHYYLTDWQGNNIGVLDRNGNLKQQVEYYPYGELRVEPIYSQKKNVNRHLFGDKERIVAGRLNEYDFLARTYVASQCRFTTIDPMAEKTPWLSPYAYCAGNPVNFIDPDGRYTMVWRRQDGTYQIFGGNIEDDDLNIYEYLQDDNGDYSIRGNSIGVTTSITSFYNSDKG